MTPLSSTRDSESTQGSDAGTRGAEQSRSRLRANPATAQKSPEEVRRPVHAVTSTGPSQPGAKGVDRDLTPSALPNPETRPSCDGGDAGGEKHPSGRRAPDKGKGPARRQPAGGANGGGPRSESPDAAAGSAPEAGGVAQVRSRTRAYVFGRGVGYGKTALVVRGPRHKS